MPVIEKKHLGPEVFGLVCDGRAAEDIPMHGKAPERKDRTCCLCIGRLYTVAFVENQGDALESQQCLQRGKFDCDCLVVNDIKAGFKTSECKATLRTAGAK